MKKTLSLLLAGLIMIASGCTASSSASEAASSPSQPVETESAEENGKTIVVYFSASGNTENIAEMIASDTNADTFVITPAEPYTEDDLRWTDENSRVNQEHNDASRQNVEIASTDIPDWDTYTTVFIGYPIWWGDASWVVKSFVQQVDFTGKTVYPFCTSSSSPIGDSGKNLADLAGTGSWQDGQRFSGSSSNEDVQTWLNSIRY